MKYDFQQMSCIAKTIVSSQFSKLHDIQTVPPDQMRALHNSKEVKFKNFHYSHQGTNKIPNTQTYPQINKTT